MDNISIPEVINAAGKLTALGGSAQVMQVASAVSAYLCMCAYVLHIASKRTHVNMYTPAQMQTCSHTTCLRAHCIPACMRGRAAWRKAFLSALTSGAVHGNKGTAQYYKSVPTQYSMFCFGL